jgi:hypothetical protein
VPSEREQYSSAPADPRERRRWALLRGAALGGYVMDGEEVERRMAEQDARQTAEREAYVKRLKGKL